MYMLANKINLLVTKYKKKCNKEVSLIGFKSDDEVTKFIISTGVAKIRDINYTLNNSCVIVLDSVTAMMDSANVVDYINKLIIKSVIIVIVPVNFDFNNFVLSVKSNYIDAINWKNNNGKKNDKYLIVVNKIIR